MKMRVGFIFIQMFCHVFMLRKMFGEMLPRFANRFFQVAKSHQQGDYIYPVISMAVSGSPKRW